MIKFIKKVSFFLLLFVGSMLAVFCLADGTTDARYYKFTTPKQTSLILGSSRAAQGIQPQELGRSLDRKDIFNYAFTIPSSPYGNIYLESIKRKLDTNSREGLFVVEVNPWIFCYKENQKTKKPVIGETNNYLDKLTYVNHRPNLQYLVGSYKNKYINILKNKSRKGRYQTFYVEENGWVRVTIEADIISTKARTRNKLEIYREKIGEFKGKSEYRLNSLKTTIDFLSKFGTVYLVRVPVIEGMLEIENDLYGDFNKDLIEISNTKNVQYFDFTIYNNKYTYTDGNHLDIESGRIFSLDLAKLIKASQEKEER